jgi:general secretion pathway protein D
MNYPTPPSAVRALSFRVLPACASIAAKAALLAASLAVLALFSPPAHAESPNSDFKQGQSAEARQDYDTAFADYQKAFQKNPKDVRFQTALYRVRVSASAAHITKGRSLLQSGDIQGALAEFLHASEIDPSNEEAAGDQCGPRKAGPVRCSL